MFERGLIVERGEISIVGIIPFKLLPLVIFAKIIPADEFI